MATIITSSDHDEPQSSTFFRLLKREDPVPPGYCLASVEDINDYMSLEYHERIKELRRKLCFDGKNVCFHCSPRLRDGWMDWGELLDPKNRDFRPVPRALFEPSRWLSCKLARMDVDRIGKLWDRIDWRIGGRDAWIREILFDCEEEWMSAEEFREVINAMQRIGIKAVEVVDEDTGWTLLHSAACCQNARFQLMDVVVAALGEDALQAVNATTREGVAIFHDLSRVTPLHLAVECSDCLEDSEMKIRCLLRIGADPNIPDGKGKVPLQYWGEKNAPLEYQYGGGSSEITSLEVSRYRSVGWLLIAKMDFYAKMIHSNPDHNLPQQERDRYLEETLYYIHDHPTLLKEKYPNLDFDGITIALLSILGILDAGLYIDLGVLMENSSCCRDVKENSKRLNIILRYIGKVWYEDGYPNMLLSCVKDEKGQTLLHHAIMESQRQGGADVGYVIQNVIEPILELAIQQSVSTDMDIVYNLFWGYDEDEYECKYEDEDDDDNEDEDETYRKHIRYSYAEHRKQHIPYSYAEHEEVKQVLVHWLCTYVQRMEVIMKAKVDEGQGGCSKQNRPRWMKNFGGEKSLKTAARLGMTELFARLHEGILKVQRLELEAKMKNRKWRRDLSPVQKSNVMKVMATTFAKSSIHNANENALQCNMRETQTENILDEETTKATNHENDPYMNDQTLQQPATSLMNGEDEAMKGGGGRIDGLPEGTEDRALGMQMEELLYQCAENESSYGADQRMIREEHHPPLRALVIASAATAAEEDYSNGEQNSGRLENVTMEAKKIPKEKRRYNKRSSMEKKLENLPTTTEGLLLTACDIYRDLGYSKEERDEKMNILKLLPLKEIQNCVSNVMHLRFEPKSSATPTTGTVTVNPVIKPAALANNTGPSYIPQTLGSEASSYGRALQQSATSLINGEDEAMQGGGGRIDGSPEGIDELMKLLNNEEESSDGEEPRLLLEHHGSGIGSGGAAEQEQMLKDVTMEAKKNRKEKQRYNKRSRLENVTMEGKQIQQGKQRKTYTPRVSLPFPCVIKHECFCTTKEKFHEIYNLSLIGVDPQKEDVSQSDWLSVFKEPRGKGKVKVNTIKEDRWEELHEKMAILHQQVYQLPFLNGEVSQTFANGFALENCSAALCAVDKTSFQVAWAIEAENSLKKRSKEMLEEKEKIFKENATKCSKCKKKS